MAFYDSRLELLEAYARNHELRALRALSERCPAHLDQQMAARIHCCNWILSLGISLCLIVSGNEYRTIYNVMFRWPLFYSMVLVWRMSMIRGWPSGLYISIRPRTEIPSDSAIIKACQENDVKCIQNLLSNSQADVNDVTPDNLTPLRVS